MPLAGNTISVIKITAFWSAVDGEPVYYDVNFLAAREILITMVGPLGSGKIRIIFFRGSGRPRNQLASRSVAHTP